MNVISETELNRLKTCRSLWIVQGGAHHHDSIRQEAEWSNQGIDFFDLQVQPYWTAPHRVKNGDFVAFYLLRPVSAIVAFAEWTNDAFIQMDEDSDFFNRYIATYNNVRLLKSAVTQAEMKNLFPEWNWSHRPQGAVKIPDSPELSLKREFTDLLISCSIPGGKEHLNAYRLVDSINLPKASLKSINLE